MESDDNDSILGLDVHVDDDQPAPRTDQCPAVSPNARELLAGAGELFQREQRVRYRSRVSAGSWRVSISSRSSSRAKRVTSIVVIG
jgi:hypothetical protein